MKTALVTKFKNRLLGLYALVAIATSIHAHAAPVVTEHGPYGEVGQAPNNTNAFVTGLHPVGTGDVLELPSTTRSIVSGRLKTEWGGAEGVLNDGLALNAGSAINYFENDSQLEFHLGAKIDMAQIDFFMYADWQRTSAWLDVHTSTDGGANWSLLHEIRQAESNNPPSVDRQYNVHSLTDPTGTLASGINAIRFTFLGDGMGSNESGYVEIDVYGEALDQPPLVDHVTDTGNLNIPEGSSATNAEVIAVQPVGTGDILETGTRDQFLSSGKLTLGSELKNINDGLAVSNGGTAGSAHNLFSVSNGSQLDFLLIGTFDITQIDLYTLWAPGSTGHAYTISTSSDGGNTFQRLRSVSLPDSGAGDRIIRGVSLTNAGGNLAKGIDAIRFIFLGDSDPVFAEIDVFGTLVSLHTETIVTEHGPYGEVGQAPNNTNAFVTGLHPVGTGDVLELPSTTRSIVSGRLKTEWGGAEGVLNDGLALNAGSAINYFENDSQLEFHLGAKIDMAQIDFFMYADWKRTSAWLDVHTSTDGGANWSLLHEIRQAESNDPPSVDRQYNVHSLTDPTGTLASGINAIRFTFLGDGMGSNESGYVEIDVYGVEAPFVITEINYSPDDDIVTLTWISRPGATYGVFMSTDLTDWSADLDDNVSADDDGETTTRTFDVLSDETELFFRVEEN